VFLVVAKLDASYRRAARYDDLLEVSTTVTGTSRVKLIHEYEVRVVERTDTDVRALKSRAEDLLVRASTTLACVDRAGRPQQLPDWLTAR
jgi:acyl-CoA thioester hydrolase